MDGLKIDWGACALARFCAPWVSNAGEKEKNALPREREAFARRRFGTRSRSWQPVKAFFSFSPGNCLRCKKRAKAHAPRSDLSSGFLIDVPPRGPFLPGGASRPASTSDPRTSRGPRRPAYSTRSPRANLGPCRRGVPPRDASSLGLSRAETARLQDTATPRKPGPCRRGVPPRDARATARTQRS